MHPIKRASQIVGGQSRLAEELKVSKGRVSQWLTEPIKAEYCPTIERLTHGQVRCEELRPDVDWAYLRATDCQTQAAP